MTEEFTHFFGLDYKLGASHYVESNLSSKDVFAKIRHALKVFEYEEELIIKFKSNGVTH